MLAVRPVSHSPILSMGPNTVLSCAVEQFHRLCLNCHWHSAIPALAPLPTPLIWSWYNWHNLVWPGDSPLIWVHNGEAPIRYWGCGSLTTSVLCTPTFLEHTHDTVTDQMLTLTLRNKWKSVRRDVPAAVTMKGTILWNITAYGLVEV
jgi:hypothetical protein